MTKQLIEKYLEGRCSPQEAQKVLEWLQTPEGQQYLEQEIDQDVRVFNEFGEYFEQRDVRSVQLFDRIQSETSDAPVGLNAQSRRIGWRKAAAVILITAILSVFTGIYLGDWDTNPETADTQPDVNVTQTQSGTNVVKTQSGERKKFALPDGSKIVLHENSSLEYLPAFKKRTVVLEGEAYFEIVHDKANRFKVYKDDSYIKVLGTVFVVKDNSSGEKIEVAVKKGKVELGTARFGKKVTTVEKLTSENTGTEESNSIEISQHEVGWLYKNGSFYVERDTLHTDKELEAGTRIMAFRNTPLRSVARKLEERYDAQFVFQDKHIADKRLTTSFDDESLEEVLKVVALSLDISYKKVDHTIYLSDE